MKRKLFLCTMPTAAALSVCLALLAILATAGEPRCADMPRIPSVATLHAPAAPADLLPELPDPYGFKAVDVGSYFSCDAPPDWSRVEGTGFGLSDEEKKTYGITLGAPESCEIPVRISLYYYAEGNLMYKSLEHYLNLFAKPVLGVALEGSSYGEVTPAKVGGRDGMMFERLKQEFVPLHNSLDPSDSPGREGIVYERRREMMARAVPVKERFMLLPAKAGFYALRYSAPADKFAKYLPVFEQVAKRFYPRR